MPRAVVLCALLKMCNMECKTIKRSENTLLKGDLIEKDMRNMQQNIRNLGKASIESKILFSKMQSNKSIRETSMEQRSQIQRRNAEENKRSNESTIREWNQGQIQNNTGGTRSIEGEDETTRDKFLPELQIGCSWLQANLYYWWMDERASLRLEESRKRDTPRNAPTPQERQQDRQQIGEFRTYVCPRPPQTALSRNFEGPENGKIPEGRLT